MAEAGKQLLTVTWLTSTSSPLPEKQKLKFKLESGGT